jgi:hypothetical protein
LIFVLCAHLLMALVLSNSGPLQRPRSLASTEDDRALVLLNLESLPEEPPVELAPAVQPPDSARRAKKARPRPAPSAAVSNEGSGESQSESTAITAPDESGGRPKTDWQLELETSVQAVAPQLIDDYWRRCHAAERARALRPPGCPRRSFDKPWRPSGSIVEQVRDPDNPHSGVPDPLPDAFPKAPPSPIRKYEQ